MHFVMRHAIFLFLWHVDKAIWLADKQVIMGRDKCNGQSLHHKRQLKAIKVQFKDDIPVVSCKEYIAVNWEVIPNGRPETSPGWDMRCVSTAGRHYACDWDFGDVQPGPSCAYGQCCKVPTTIKA